MANQKLFNRPKPQSKILREIRARREAPGSYGRITNRATGETITIASDDAPEVADGREYIKATKGSNGQNKSETAPRVGQSMDEDLLEADEGFRQFAQRYEDETGEMPSYEDYQQSMDNQENAKPVEVEKEDFTDTLNQFFDFAEDKGLTFDDVLNKVDADYLPDDVVSMLMDPDKIKTEEDLDKVATAIEAISDALNIDTNKMFREGVVEECGEECQAERERMLNGNA